MLRLFKKIVDTAREWSGQSLLQILWVPHIILRLVASEFFWVFSYWPRIHTAVNIATAESIISWLLHVDWVHGVSLKELQPHLHIAWCCQGIPTGGKQENKVMKLDITASYTLVFDIHWSMQCLFILQYLTWNITLSISLDVKHFYFAWSYIAVCYVWTNAWNYIRD